MFVRNRAVNDAFCYLTKEKFNPPFSEIYYKAIVCFIHGGSIKKTTIKERIFQGKCDWNIMDDYQG